MPIEDPIDVHLQLSPDTPPAGENGDRSLDLGTPPTEQPEGEGREQILAVDESKVRRTARLLTNIVAELAHDPGMRLTRFESEDLVPVFTGAINEHFRLRKLMEQSDNALALSGAGYMAYWRGARFLRRRRGQAPPPESGAQEPAEELDEEPEAEGEEVAPGGKQFWTGPI